MQLRRKFILSTIISIACAALPVATLAQETTAPETPEFLLELNNAQDTDTGGCRLTYVATNGSPDALSETAFEFAVFDAEGVVSRILVLEFGALIAGKTKILQFDLPDGGCENLSRIVVNNVAACTLADGSDAGALCSEGLTTRSRTAIQFGT